MPSPKPSSKTKSQIKPLQVLVANGVNLDLLGSRESEHYGTVTLKEIAASLENSCASIAAVAGVRAVELEFFQTNCEHELLEKFSSGKYAGVLINAGAWTHTSLALADRLRGLSISYVEVHLSNISAREEFRKQSFLAAGAVGVVYGMGSDSYLAGLLGLLRHLGAKPREKK